MSNIAIQIEGLTKEYRLGVISHRTLYRDVQSRISRLMNREDPNSLIGTDPQRTRGGKFHALDNISLEVQQGDVVGIIGKNGAGKSTLLKILSRVTGPTLGEVKIRGRIASLLEVGTGFHPELTGRENVYLNGAILGMRKREVAAKFDEITAFSGIEEFIDTPVKRYSSGMYVRLAFAVAAHLEPEILIVDEVLAVGDAEFRKKCITKMSEVSKTGRTILFVSHEMSAITSLCNKGVLMENGKITAQGQIESVVSQYSFKIAKQATDKSWIGDQCPGDKIARLRSVRLIDHNYESIQSVYFGREFGVEIVYEILEENSRINPGVTMYSSGGQILLVSFPPSDEIKTAKGVYKAYCWFPAGFLNADIFSIRINAHTFYPTKVHFDVMDSIQFEVIEYDIEERKIDYMDKLYGFTRMNLDWKIK
jgi:lipopolysaccharide transport system ATP-binding protein